MTCLPFSPTPQIKRVFDIKFLTDSKNLKIRIFLKEDAFINFISNTATVTQYNNIDRIVNITSNRTKKKLAFSNLHIPINNA